MARKIKDPLPEKIAQLKKHLGEVRKGWVTSRAHVETLALEISTHAEDLQEKVLILVERIVDMAYVQLSAAEREKLIQSRLQDVQLSLELRRQQKR
jgi:hypothetical protein